MTNQPLTLTMPKPHDDPDLVFFIDKHLREIYKATLLADVFITSPNIVSIKNSHSSYQRVFINRYFTELLLKIRSENNVNVSNALMLLINDASSNDWFKVMTQAFFPTIHKLHII